MCDPVSMAVIGAAAGNIAGWGATGTILAGAAGGAALGQVGKEAGKMLKPPAAPAAPGTPTAARAPTQPQAPGSTGASRTGGMGPGGFASTLLTGGRGASVAPGLLGGATLLGG